MGVKSASAAPIRKVSAGLVGGAVATLILWSLSQYANFNPPQPVADAITTLISFAVAYVIPPSPNDAPLMVSQENTSVAGV